MIMKINEITPSIISRFSKEVFIYPTDTVYGIGCDAENKELVEKIREIKKRDMKPFSVIALSVKWIIENFEISKEEIDKYLPGAYTLILKKKNKDFLKCVSEGDYVGIRIPKNKFTNIVQKIGRPIVTTSVNIAGEKPANSVKEINKSILDEVDLVIDGGVLSGKISTLIKDGKVLKR